MSPFGGDRADSFLPWRRVLPADTSAIVVVTLLTVLVGWNVALVSTSPLLTAALFLVGPFLGLGIMLSLLTDTTETAALCLYLGAVNAVVLTAVISAVVRFTPGIPFTVPSLAIAFDAVYLLVVAALRFVRPDSLRSLPSFDLDVTDVLVAIGCLVGLSVAVVAAELKATTGNSALVVVLYLWVLAGFLVLLLRQRTTRRHQVLFLVTAGVAMLWVQALSTNALYAVDGLDTMRFVRATVSGVHVQIFDRRLYYSLTVSGFLPGVSQLTTLRPYWIAKYVLPVSAALSLVGVYRLSREWLDARDAFAATFLLSFTYPFAAELLTLYRSSVAFPVFVAFFVVLTLPYDRRRQGLLLLYLGGTLLLHDSLGVFLVGVLVVTTAVTILARYVTDRDLSGWRVTWVFSLTGVGAVGFLAVATYMSALKPFAIRAAQLVAGFFGITVGRNLRSPRTVDTTVGGINGSIVELLRRYAITSEIALMAVGTAILLAGLLWRDRLERALPWHDADGFHEILLVANAAWFGLLALRPVLGAPRVFLYASPLLVGLFVFAVRQIGGVFQLASERFPLFEGWTAWRWSADPLTVMLAVLLATGFVFQTGLATAAIGSPVAYPGLSNPANPQLRYYNEGDVVANDWAVAHVSENRSLLVDKHSYSLFLDDPEVAYSRLVQLQAGADFATLPTTGCLFLRTANVRSGLVYAYSGAPGQAVLRAFPQSVFVRHDTVYTTGAGPRLVCSSSGGPG